MPYGREFDDAGNIIVGGIPQPPWDDADEQERLDTLIAKADEAFTGQPVIIPADTTSTWADVDLAAILTGDTPPLMPTILARDDGPNLIYPGKVHSVSGESESGKTWLLLAAVVGQLLAAEHVIYIDFEDSAEAITARLQALHVPDQVIAAQVHYSRPDTPLDDQGRAQLAKALTHRPTLAVIDGVTEAMTIHGYETSSNDGAALFYALLPRWLAHQGPAVALIDHVPKDEERNKRYALGAQHKLAGLDGAAYMVDLIRPFGHGQHGISRVRISKDRPGRVREHSPHGHACDLHLQSDNNGGVTLTLRPPVAYDGPDGSASGFRPTHLMEKVSRYVEVHPGMSGRAIVTAVKGRDEHVRLALELLVAEGFISTGKGDRNAIIHSHGRPYREPTGEEPPDDDEGS